MQAHTQEGDYSKTSGPHLEIHDSCTVCNSFNSYGTLSHFFFSPLSHFDAKSSVLSLQRVLGLKSLDGVLNPSHVNGKHIVHNVFSINKAGIVILENKAGMMH